MRKATKHIKSMAVVRVPAEHLLVKFGGGREIVAFVKLNGRLQQIFIAH